MDGSKCVISTKTHGLVVDRYGKPTIYDDKVLLHNRPGNCLVEVPVTLAIRQMFKLDEKMNPSFILESDVRTSNKNITVEDCSQSAEEAQADELTATQDVLLELLISEISKRPPLYNEKLPLQQRSRSIKIALEKEVYEALGGQMPLEDISKKWAYLKKEYKRHRAQLNRYVKSGCSLEEAAKITGKPLWKHYKALTFIDDVIDDVKTQTNVQLSVNPISPSSSSETGCSMMSPRECSTPSSVPKKRKTNSTENTPGVSEKLLDQMIIGELQTKTNNTKLDSCDHFCAMLALEMKKLDSRQRAELQIKFLTMLNEMLYG